MLRRMAMMSDAISHSILLGIVIGFFVVSSTSSPLLIFFAAAVGLLTVVLVAVLWDVLLTPFVMPPLLAMFRKLEPEQRVLA